jgi:hypothetical protein
MPAQQDKKLHQDPAENVVLSKTVRNAKLSSSHFKILIEAGAHPSPEVDIIAGKPIFLFFVENNERQLARDILLAPSHPEGVIKNVLKGLISCDSVASFRRLLLWGISLFRIEGIRRPDPFSALLSFGDSRKIIPRLSSLSLRCWPHFRISGSMRGMV